MNQASCRQLAAWVCAFVAGGALAQDFPNKPVRVVVANPVGSSSDIVTRIIIPGMSRLLGQPVIVEPKPGNDQRLGAEYVAKQVAADGYTIGVYALSNLASVPALVKDAKFDPLKDLPPMTTLVVGRSFLGTPPNAPWRDFNEMVTYARANPGKLNYASSAVSQRLRIETVLQAKNINVVHVPYQTSGAMEQALLGGQAHLMIANDAQISNKSGLWALAVTGERRSAKFPGVPTFIELGLPPVPGAEYSLHTPAGVPKPAYDRLYSAVSRTLQQPDVKLKLDQLGYEIVNDSPEAAAKYLAGQIKLVFDVVKKIGLQPE